MQASLIYLGVRCDGFVPQWILTRLERKTACHCILLALLANARDCESVKLLKEVLRSQARAHQTGGEFTRQAGRSIVGSNSGNPSPSGNRKEDADAELQEASVDIDRDGDPYRPPSASMFGNEITDEWADGSELEGARRIEDLCSKLRSAEAKLPPAPRPVYSRADEGFVFYKTHEDPSVRAREAERAAADFIARHHRWELTEEFLHHLSNTRNLQDRLDVVTPSNPYHHNLRRLHNHLLKDDEAFRRALWAPPPAEGPKGSTGPKIASLMPDGTRRFSTFKKPDKTLLPFSRTPPAKTDGYSTMTPGHDRSLSAGTMRRDRSAPSVLRRAAPTALEFV